MSERTIPHALLKRILARKTFLLIAALIVIGSAASAWAFLSSGPKSAAPAPSPETDRVEAEVITIRPRGFEPTEIKRPKGRYLLVVNNRSWEEEVELRLEREDGGRVREVRRRRNKPDWREMVDLPPGQYVLREANHPEWACRITITPQ